MEAFQVIFVALIVSIFAPLIMAMLTGRQQRMSKQQDWDRQDQLAARAEAAAEALAARTAEALRITTEEAATKVAETAHLLLEAQASQAQRTDEVARLAAKNQAIMTTQLIQIHTLVNSDMTAARQELLDQTRITLMMLRTIISDDVQAGRPSRPDDLQAITDTERRIDTLRAILADRLAQQKIVEREQQEAKKAAARVAETEDE